MLTGQAGRRSRTHRRSGRGPGPHTREHPGAVARYIALAFGAAQWPFKYDNLQRECAVGFSGSDIRPHRCKFAPWSSFCCFRTSPLTYSRTGVLFGLMAIKAIVTPSSTTTVIFFQVRHWRGISRPCVHARHAPCSDLTVSKVPSTLMPWVSLAMIQVMIPGASFVGHLAGILTAYMCGCMPPRAVPPPKLRVCGPQSKPGRRRADARVSASLITAQVRVRMSRLCHAAAVDSGEYRGEVSGSSVVACMGVYPHATFK
jgi:hypothetical protein